MKKIRSWFICAGCAREVDRGYNVKNVGKLCMKCVKKMTSKEEYQRLARELERS
jgi:recombinational DNA repair protein (RecF pathway)